MAVNILVIIALGGVAGVLSGMFGVGGGFLTTPLLILYGIPPTVAAASAATQVTGASVSGVAAHMQNKGVDFHMGAVLVVGGLIGTIIGAFLFEWLETWGQADIVIGLFYVLLLGGVGAMMIRDWIAEYLARRRNEKITTRKRRHHPLVAALPGRWRFYRSALYISPLAPLLLGVVVGILTILLGVGGGFIMVPAMLYLLGMRPQLVVGTSLFQILFVTIAATMVHSLTTRAVDIVLAALLLLGSVTGAQFGAQFARKLPPTILRGALALVVLAVAIRMALELGYRPDEIYSIQGLDT